MERSTWTDARLDDRFDQIDRRFDQVDRRFDRLETELREGFAGVGGEIADLRADIGRLQATMTRSYVALAIALVAAIVVRGV